MLTFLFVYIRTSDLEFRAIKCIPSICCGFFCFYLLFMLLLLTMFNLNENKILDDGHAKNRKYQPTSPFPCFSAHKLIWWNLHLISIRDVFLLVSFFPYSIVICSFPPSCHVGHDWIWLVIASSIMRECPLFIWNFFSLFILIKLQ